MGSRRVGHDWATYFHFSLSCTGEGNGNPLQCSCLENPRDGGAWWPAVYGAAQSWTRLKRLSSSSSSRAYLHSWCFTLDESITHKDPKETWSEGDYSSITLLHLTFTFLFERNILISNGLQMSIAFCTLLRFPFANYVDSQRRFIHVWRATLSIGLSVFHTLNNLSCLSIRISFSAKALEKLLLKKNLFR